MALDVAICDERMGEWGNAVLPRMWQRARYLWNLGFDTVTSGMPGLLTNLCCFVG